MPELRVELEKFIVDVMDGYCSGTGMCRTKLANQILGESEKRRCRVARVGIGVGVSGGRGRKRSCTVVRRECWCRRWGVRRS